MAATDPIVRTVYAGSSPRLMARVRIDDGGALAYVQQADIDTISYEVWERGRQVGETGALDPGNTVYDSLQTGTTWKEAIDSVGGNFAFRLDGAYIPNASRRYVVVVTFTLSGGTSFPVEWHLITVSPTR